MVKCDLYGTCKDVNITITFERNVDIQQICFRQGFIYNSTNFNYIQQIKITYNEYFNEKYLTFNLKKDYNYRCYLVHLKNQYSLTFSPEKFYESNQVEFALSEIGVWGYSGK